MLNYKLFAVFAFILTSGIFFDDAFARAGSEVTPTQTNAYASYNIATNDVQVEWDFDTLPADTVCLLKGDFWYYNDLAVDYGNNAPADQIKSFTPLYYSPVTSNPTTFQAVNGEPDAYAEETSCSGSLRIDLDTVMNHSQNVNNYNDLQIFLTFYKAVNGEFTTASNQRIDEVFVMFTPTSVFATAAQEYGCGGQIGSTLYIDKSGTAGATAIHGNNGDNCDGAEFKYVELQSNEWVDIGMDTSPGLSLGTISKGNHVAEAFSLLIQVVEQIIAAVTTHGGSDDDHNSRPTFGFDHKTFVQRVAEGLVINDEVYTVTDNYWTPMPMLYLEVGATQNFTSTVFAPHQLKIMEFAFGIPEVGHWYDREASIEIETNYNGEVISSEVVEFTYPPVINATSLESSVSKVKCVANDNSEPCYRVSVEFSFLEAPIGNVFGVQAIDQDRKNQILYFNDGLDITGESQNPPTVKQIISEIKYKGLQTIQRIDKENNIWMSMDKSEPVFLYKQNDHGSFNPIVYRTFDAIPDKMTTNIDRLHSEFSKLIEYEQNRAVEEFDSTLLVSELPASWKYDYSVKSTTDAELDESLKEEAQRAQQLLIELLSMTHYATIVSNDSTVGIIDEFTDRTLGDILAEERATDKMLADERAYLKQVTATVN